MLAKLDVALYIFLPVAIIASSRISLLVFFRQCANVFFIEIFTLIFKCQYSAKLIFIKIDPI